MSIQTEPTTTESPETSYSALEHTITTDGGWPVCAGCGEPGSHEACVAAENRLDHAQHQRARHGSRRRWTPSTSH